MKKTVILAILLAVAVAGGIAYRQSGEAEAPSCVASREVTLPKFQPTVPPRPVPQVPFLDGDGGQRTIADFKGKVVLLNFWATWCPPCVREMPALDHLRAMLAPEGVEVLALSQDRGRPVDQVRAFLADRRLTNLGLYFDDRSSLGRALGVDGLPTSLLIDAHGYEVGRLTGMAEWDGPQAVRLIRGCLPGGAGS